MAKKILRTVTVTGADDTTDPYGMMDVARDYPFVEFGILVSKKREGTHRMPTRKWINSLLSLNSVTQNALLSCHVCGEWVRELLLGKFPGDFRRYVHPGFGRYQLNTHGEPHLVDDDGLRYVTKVATLLGKEIIFQFDQVNIGIMDRAVDLKRRGFKVSGLSDLSHGAGILPDKWPAKNSAIEIGYAGGLSPENVAEQLFKIETLTDGPTWIDAETRLMGTNGFDLNRVRAFLEMAKPWVIGA